MGNDRVRQKHVGDCIACNTPQTPRPPETSYKTPLPPRELAPEEPEPPEPASRCQNPEPESPRNRQNAPDTNTEAPQNLSRVGGFLIKYYVR